MLKVVRYSQFTVTPWKNGGGITREALRKDPAGELEAAGDPKAGGGPQAADFVWRLSVAQVDKSGPFSNFAGYKRTLVLLQGAGVRLRFSDRTVTELRAAGDLVTFDGALAADCQLLGDPCVDLNLMVAASVTVTAATIESVARELAIDDVQATTLLCFCINGSVSIEEEGTPAVVLERWDVGAVSRPAAATKSSPPGVVRLAPHDTGTPATVFIARLID